jgi:hypothetical protein
MEKRFTGTIKRKKLVGEIAEGIDGKERWGGLLGNPDKKLVLTEKA